MSESNFEKSRLEDAIKKISPERAEQAKNIADKYDALSAQLDEMLTGSDKKDTIVIARNQLETGKKLIIDEGEGLTKAPKKAKKEMVSTFEKELDAIGDSINLTGSVEDVPRDVRATFTKIHKFLDALHINHKFDDLIQAYLAMPESFRVDPKTVTESFEALAGKVGNSQLLMSKLYERQYDLLTVLGLFCNGAESQAKAKTAELMSFLDSYTKMETFEKETGLKLSEVNLNLFLSVLKDNNVSIKEASDYVIKIKNLSPVDFKSWQLNEEELVQNLIALIIDLRDGTKRDQEAIKYKMNVIAIDSTEKAKAQTKIAKYQVSLTEYTQELSKYREENPTVTYDKKIAVLERNIAVCSHDIAVASVKPVLAKAQSDLAMSHLSSAATQPGSKESLDFLAKIRKTNSSEKLLALAKAAGLNDVSSLTTLAGVEAHLAEEEIDFQLKVKEETFNSDEYVKFYNDFLNGDLSEEGKKVILAQLRFESRETSNIINKLNVRLDSDKEFFQNVITKYGKLENVPEEEEAEVTTRLGAYASLLERRYAMTGKLYANYSSAGLLGEKSVTDDDGNKFDLDKEMKDVDAYAKVCQKEIEDVAKFFGMDNFKTVDFANLSVSPLHAPILARETAPFQVRLEKSFNSIAEKAQGLVAVGSDFERIGKNPDLDSVPGVGGIGLFDRGLKAFDEVVGSMVAARSEVAATRSDVLKLLNDVKGGNNSVISGHPELSGTLIKILETSIQKMDLLLDSEDSPIHQGKIIAIKADRIELGINKTNYIEGSLKFHAKMIAVGIILVGSALLFGVGAATIAASRVFGVTGAVALTGWTSLGGTFGLSVGMESANALGLSEFKNVWNPEEMAKNFFIGWGFSLGAVLAARGTLHGLSKAALLEGRVSSVLVAKPAQWLLSKLDFLRKVASPVSLFTSREAALKNGLKGFGVRYVNEFGEEVAEGTVSALFRGNPVAEFFASMVNASDGFNIELGQVGVDAGKLGISTEGSSFAFNQATAEDFLANLKSYFGGKKGSDYTAIKNADGSVTLNIGTKASKSIQITVHPGNRGLTPDVEIKRFAENKAELDNESGFYSLKSLGKTLSLIFKAKDSGFRLTRTPNGFKISKAGFSGEFVLQENLRAELDTFLGELESQLSEVEESLLAYEKNPSPGLFAKIQHGLLLLATSLATSGCYEELQEVMKNAGEGAAKAGKLVGLLIFTFALELGLTFIDFALPVVGTWRALGTRTNRTRVFTAVKTFKAQLDKNKAGDLNIKIQNLKAKFPSIAQIDATMITMDATAPSPAPAARPVANPDERAAVAEEGIRFKELLVKVRDDGSTLAESLESVFGADAKELKKTMAELNTVLDSIMRDINSGRTINASIFAPKMTKLAQLVDKFDPDKDVHIKNADLKVIKAYMAGAIAFLLWQMLRRFGLLTGRNLVWLFDTNATEGPSTPGQPGGMTEKEKKAKEEEEEKKKAAEEALKEAERQKRIQEARDADAAKKKAEADAAEKLRKKDTKEPAPKSEKTEEPSVPETSSEPKVEEEEYNEPLTPNYGN